ncbi:MAG: GumC family protein, partial [Pseudomonadota bacterium]
MSQRTPQSDDDMDLGALFGAMRRSLPTVILCSILAGGLTYVVLSMTAPRYTSDAQLAIASKRTNPFPEKDTPNARQDTVAPLLDREAINTHVRALNAPSLLLRVANELNLSDRPEFNPAAGTASRLDGLLRMVGVGKPNPKMSDSDRVLANVKDRLQVAAARETRYISIKFSSADPKLAARFANTLADNYRKSLVDIPVRETSDAVEALLPKIEQLNQEVVAAEAELERFRAKTDRLLTGNQQVPLNSQRLGQLNEELSRAEAARTEAQSRWRTAQGLLRTGSAEVLPEVQQSNTIQGLINQRVRLERQVNEASAALLPRHPRMRQLNADLSGLKRSISGEVRK